VTSDEGYNKYVYKLTRPGKNVANKIKAILDDKSILSKLSEARDLNKMSVASLVEVSKSLWRR
jgi:hypothetical protein